MAILVRDRARVVHHNAIGMVNTTSGLSKRSPDRGETVRIAVVVRVFTVNKRTITIIQVDMYVMN